MSLDRAARDALVTAIRAAARVEILPLFRKLDAGQVSEKTSPEDLVTAADRDAETAIGASVRRILPDAAIIGEEAVSADGALLGQIATSPLVVVIDPIDGTWNFVNGIATYGVLLAVIARGQTILGILYDPTGDDWIMAERGGGAWFCRPDRPPRRLRVSAPSERLSDAFGFIGLYNYPRAARPLLAASLPDFRRACSLRCACHEYRLLTAGRADFGLNGTLNVWDHAAGALCFEEAGGHVALLNGASYAPTMTEGRLLTAASRPLWDQLAEKWADLA
ncbi:MAG: inositol monophosphatase [Pseudomonadota bacterium]